MLKIKIKNNNKKGFTLLEALIVVFIFTLAMISFTEYFAKFSKSSKDAKEIQKNLENAQYAMNLMAKTLRTSSIRVVGSSESEIRGYDYSQEKCFNFWIAGHKINYGEKVVPNVVDIDMECGSIMPPPILDLTSEIINDLKFSFERSDATAVPPQMGKVTIFMEVGTGEIKERIQTTVSLRDYSVAGIE